MDQKEALKRIYDTVVNLCETANLTSHDIANFLINEVQSVCNKHNVEWNIFPPTFIYILLVLRKHRKITNSQIRKYLSDHVEWVKAGKPDADITT